MRIQATDFQVTYTVKVPFTLPDHSGSLLRGVLGRALRRTGCARPEGTCAGVCEMPGVCAYTQVFDPPAPSSPPHRFLKGATGIPPRLIPLLPAMGAIKLAAGDVLDFGVRVLGQLDDDTEKRLTGALEGITDLPLTAEGGRLEFDAVTRRGRRNRAVATERAPQAEGAFQDEGAQQAVGRLRVTLETPAWIEHQGRLVEELTFPRLFRSIYRRLTTLCALYGELGENHEEAFARLDAAAKGVTIVDASLRRLRWERLSESRGARHPMCGIIGWALFKGEVGMFMPVMAMAEVTHVGKSTSFGLGRVRMVRERL